MQIYIKLYDTIRDTIPFYNDSIISDVEINKDIATFDTASFRMEIIPRIQTQNKIEIYEVVN
jgi:hypothetical protein